MPDGTRVTLRHLRLDEVRSFYDALTMAIRSSAGYGLDELPSISYFVRWYVNDFHNIVYELTATGQTIAYTNFGESPFSRSSASKLTDGNMVILPEWRSKKWFRHLSMINFAKENVLMTAGQGETAIVNLASLKVSLQFGYIVNGVLPKGIYFKDHGWMDLVMYYRPADAVTEEKNENQNKSKI